jgi:hypothetical protein
LKSNTASETNTNTSNSSVAFPNNNTSDLKPTLATGEDSDQHTDSHEAESSAIEPKKSGKRLGHVRQASIVSGSGAQAIQVIHGASASNKVLLTSAEQRWVIE